MAGRPTLGQRGIEGHGAEPAMEQGYQIVQTVGAMDQRANCRGASASGCRRRSTRQGWRSPRHGRSARLAPGGGVCVPAFWKGGLDMTRSKLEAVRPPGGDRRSPVRMRTRSSRSLSRMLAAASSTRSGWSSRPVTCKHGTRKARQRDAAPRTRPRHRGRARPAGQAWPQPAGRGRWRRGSRGAAVSGGRGRPAGGLRPHG